MSSAPLSTSSSCQGEEALHRAALASRDRSKRRFRIVFVGMLYGAAIGFAVPVSPMFRLALPQNPNVMKLVFHASLVSGLSSSVAYARLIDRPSTDPASPSVNGTRPSVLPQLGLMTAQVPGLAALVGCHAMYPGFFVAQWEPTWRLRITEYARLTAKVTLAYSTSHVPYCVAASSVIGSTIWSMRRFSVPERIKVAWYGVEDHRPSA